MAANSGGTEKKKRGPGRPFEKGKSGNPNGRPKMPEETKEILKAAAPEAAALLVELMRDETQPAKIRKGCAESLLDRVYGKPTQPIDGKMTVAAVEITDDDARAALEALGYVRK